MTSNVSARKCRDRKPLDAVRDDDGELYPANATPIQKRLLNALRSAGPAMSFDEEIAIVDTLLPIVADELERLVEKRGLS